jgi:hypothetical protein
MLGYDWSLSYSAMIRHAQQFWFGQSRSDDGNHHLACVAWHALVLIECELLGIGTDDRSYRKAVPITSEGETVDLDKILGEVKNDTQK